MRTACLIVGLCAALMLGSCKREIANRNLEQLKKNMSPKEVETILGPPDGSDRKDDEGDGEKRYAGLITFYYVQDGQKIALQFFNGHLVREPGLLKEH
jgi:hypothetical protein